MAVTVSGINSAATGSLNAPGVGSGLDVKGLVSQLMAVEQQPITLLNTQEAHYQAKLTSLGTVSSSVSALQTAAQSLVSASTTSFSASSSDSTIVSAGANSTAVAGSYAVTVGHLAQVQKLVAGGRASATAAIGAGTSTTVTFQLGTITGGTLTNGIYSPVASFAASSAPPVSITIDSSNNTLNGIRDAINKANAGVTATIVSDGSGLPYRLTLTSAATGATNSLQVTVNGDSSISTLLAYDASTATQNLVQTQVAQDAALTVDGISITSASNTVSGAIQGGTLILGKLGGPATVTIARDTNSLTTALNALVQAYNNSNKAIAGVTAKGADLQGDWGVLGLQRQIRSILSGAQATGGAFTTLSQLGISFQKDGSLALDSSKLSAAMAASTPDVIALTSILGTAIKTAADAILGTTGPIANRSNGINLSIKDIGSRRTTIQNRLVGIQARYLRQYGALDTMLSSMNATSSFLTQQMSALPKLGTM